MKTYYHSAGRRSAYFEGWYIKLQTADEKAIALIPALHTDRFGTQSASLQILTDGGAVWLDYPAAAFQAFKHAFSVRIGENLFSDHGVQLRIDRDGLSLHGDLYFGSFSSLRSDIMGPFRFLSNMECSHGVISMGHELHGILFLNGKAMDFSGGIGYIETDRGRSFPSAYLWTQCAWQTSQRGSLMLSIADIPLAMVRFTGCICAILFHGQEYRLATYRGARIEQWSSHGAVISQGKHRLEASTLGGLRHPLQAPVHGDMGRTIHECLCADMVYRFWEKDVLLFEHRDCCASFEYAANVLNKTLP